MLCVKHSMAGLAALFSIAACVFISLGMASSAWISLNYDAVVADCQTPWDKRFNSRTYAFYELSPLYSAYVPKLPGNSLDAEGKLFLNDGMCRAWALYPMCPLPGQGDSVAGSGGYYLYKCYVRPRSYCPFII
jgi:hypothetical protein